MCWCAGKPHIMAWKKSDKWGISRKMMRIWLKNDTKPNQAASSLESIKNLILGSDYISLYCCRRMCSTVRDLRKAVLVVFCQRWEIWSSYTHSHTHKPAYTLRWQWIPNNFRPAVSVNGIRPSRKLQKIEFMRAMYLICIVVLHWWL